MSTESAVVRRNSRRAAPRSNGNGNGNATEPGNSLDLRELLRALQAMRDGDFWCAWPGDQTGLAGKIADTFNEIVVANQRLADELERVGKFVGRTARRGIAWPASDVPAAWGAMEQLGQSLIDDLLWPTTEVTRAITAVAKGDLPQTMRLEVDGRPLRANSCARRPSSTR